MSPHPPGAFSRRLLSGRRILMDAAMATTLGDFRPDAPGMASRILSVHAGAVAAGAEVLLTATFGLNPAAAPGLDLDVLIPRRVAIARRAAGRSVYVLADVGPILSEGYREFADLSVLARVLSCFDGVDGFLFETASSPAVLSAAAYAFHRVPEAEHLPILVSLTYRREGGRLTTFSGHAPELFARHAERHGIAALGVNCGRDLSADDYVEIVRRYCGETDLPLFARPNAGSPVDGGRYPMTPVAFGELAGRLYEAGATMVGGCCGTTAEYLTRVTPTPTPAA